MRKYFFVLFVTSCVLILPTKAQNRKSIHQIEYEKHIKDLPVNLNKNKSLKIIPLKVNSSKTLTKAVFGYYPDWEYLNSSYNNFRYDLLTHIAAFDFKASATGSINLPAGWPWTDLINEAHSNGVKIIMVVVNFDKDEIRKIITNSTSRWIFMNSVKAKIKQYSLDGVNIDFEGLYQSDRGSRLNDFMQELSDTVHNISPELEVSYAAPAVNWGGWNLEGLANSCDYLFIMGYDFFGSWSSVSGPTAPLTGGSYNITNTVLVQYKNVTERTPEKLILGVPYFGPHWTTSGKEENATVLEYQGAVRFRNAAPGFESNGTLWSSKYNTSWYEYLSGFTQHQVWVDNDSSLSLKYDLAISKNLKGIGMWALGYDGARNELWDLLEDKLVSVKSKTEKPDKFLLLQNYPNPFNPTTTIQYTIPSAKTLHTTSQYVQLKVYDLLGREVATLINEEEQPGNYSIIFNGSDLSAGTYFYQLRYGNYLQTKKMILLQ